ncbi:MAG: hypothetical protein KGO81_15280 [Bacteroidota bacterium]|nr:hypothetical protein [Bacteroidota bacterium]
MAYTQNYHALNGSSFAGIFSMYNNPAGIVNCDYKWDLNLFSAQGTITNTAATLKNFSLSNYDSAYIDFTNGRRSRFLHTTVDINLFNFRIKLDEKSALGIGFRARSYNHSKMASFFYTDTVTTLPGFLHINTNTDYLSGYVTHSGWLEADIDYARIISSNDHQRISAGVTLGILKSISGAEAQANRFTYQETLNANNQYNYYANGGNAMAAYSSNYDLLDGNRSTAANAKTFLKNTTTHLSLSLGAEILLKDFSPYAEEEISSTNYDWKIGVSIMDIGKNTFTPNGGAFYTAIPDSGVSAARLENIVSNATSMKRFRDSMLNVFQITDTITDPFAISLPTRLLLSVDRNLGNHFYINGQLNVNFYSTQQPSGKIRTRELNLLTITPRWETRTLGFYLPIQYNTQGQLWIGSAIKLGPFLLGFHNIGWILGKQFKDLNGGGYFAFHFTPKPKQEKTRLDCFN